MIRSFKYYIRTIFIFIVILNIFMLMWYNGEKYLFYSPYETKETLTEYNAEKQRLYLETTTTRKQASTNEINQVSNKKTIASGTDLLANDKNINETRKSGQLNISANEILKEFVRKQDEEKIKINKYCRTHKITLNLRRYSNAFFVDKTKNLISCLNYKVASSTIKRTFENNHLKMDKISSFSPANMKKDMIKVMMVRHPMNRLVSAYKDKLKDGNKPFYFNRNGQHMVKAYRKIPQPHSKITTLMKEVVDYIELKEKIKKDPKIILKINTDNPFFIPIGPTFREFFQSIADQRYLDEHWRSYNEHCGPCAVHYDFVLRFENLEEHLNLFLRYLSPNTSTTEIEKINASEQKNSDEDETVCDYLKEIDEKLYERVLKWFKTDFEMFNYDIHKFDHCLSKQ